MKFRTMTMWIIVMAVLVGGLSAVAEPDVAVASGRYQGNVPTNATTVLIGHHNDFTVKHFGARCTNSGGKYDEGSLTFRMSIYEGLWIDATRVYIRVWATQYRQDPTRDGGYKFTHTGYDGPYGRYLDKKYVEASAGPYTIRQFRDNGATWFETKVPRKRGHATGYWISVWVLEQGKWSSFWVRGNAFCGTA